jgi:hypothetical protein
MEKQQPYHGSEMEKKRWSKSLRGPLEPGRLGQKAYKNDKSAMTVIGLEHGWFGGAY